MPRDPHAVTDLASGAAVAQPAGTAIAPANGAVINAANDTSRVAVRVTNTAASAKIVTFKAGSTNPPAVRKGLGDLAVSLPAGADRVIVLESARHCQPDGTINVDFETGMTGIISTVRVPKGA